ncbi:MAG: PilZ domain-containing protein [Thiolinea sp.]
METQKLTLSLLDRNEVHNHYLPMIQGGGIFVPTALNLAFYSDVLLQVDLLSERQKASIPGKVVWVTPAGAQRGLMKGVGIKFAGEHQPRIQQYFESLISDRLLKTPDHPCY